MEQVSITDVTSHVLPVWATSCPGRDKAFRCPDLFIGDRGALHLHRGAGEHAVHAGTEYHRPPHKPANLLPLQANKFYEL